MPESIRIDEPHLRRCWSCGTTNEHQSRITPGVLCPKCGSQDTRAVEEKAAVPESKPSELGLPYTVGQPAHWSDDGRFIYAANGDHVASWVMPDRAAFIVKACNAHDELLAVVRLAIDLFQFATFDNGVHSPSGQSEAEHWAGQCRERMEAILAKATA